MKFVSPHWLWALLLLPILYGLIRWEDNGRQRKFARFADRKLWAFIAPEMLPGYRVKKGLLAIVALGFTFIALARPQMGSHEETVQVAGLDIMIALDVSSSMDVEDVVPSRLKKAKHVIKTIVSQLNGDRVGVVAFAASSYVSSPLTADLSYLMDTVQILGPKMIQNQGTDIGVGVETALKALERGGEEIAPAGQKGDKPSHVIILLTDGEDHEGGEKSVANKVRESGAKLYVLGIGTETGGPIPMRDETGNSQGYKKDSAGHSVLSTFQPQSLMKLADAAGGKYWNVTTGETEVEELLEEMGALNRTDYAERKFTVYEDRFQIPLLIAIILFFFEISVPARKILLLCLFLSAPLVRADGVLKKPVPLDSYLDNQKGIDAYKAGRIEEAQKNFGSAQARDPSRPELEFNQGVVQMQQGDTDRALESFNNSARAAIEKQDKNLLGKSLYNMGNGFSKKGDIGNAIRSYLGAINSAAEAKNAALEDESRKNLQLLINEVKKQQQKQKDQEDKKKQEQKKQDQGKQEQKGGEGKDQQSKSNSDKENGKQDQAKQNQDDKKDPKDPNQEERYKETTQEDRKQQFKSRKMTPEDADRVMSELTNRERELQEKLQTQHAQSKYNQKDW